jgi:ADP-ribosylglycohydrolase
MLDHILGGLYGQALGDAWAMPALLTPVDTREYYHGWIDRLMDAPPGHPAHHGLKAGQVTDDTQQAFALAHAMITDKRVTPQGVAQALLTWYDSIGGDTSPYVGPSSRKALQAIRLGADLNTTGSTGDTNGAAMRISPVGLIHPGDLAGAVEDVALACLPTHNTDVAISGAAAIAGAISRAMLPGSTLEQIIQDGCKAADLGRQRGRRWFGASVSQRIEMAVEIASTHQSLALTGRSAALTGRFAEERIQRLYDRIGSSLSITESVPAAFGILLLAQGDPHQAAIYAAALSGDADTVAAMACAIAGAWVGVKAFNPAVLAQLRAANPELDFENTANGLFHLAQAPPSGGQGSAA